MKVSINRLIAWLLDFSLSIVFFNYLLSFDVFIGVRENIIQRFLELSFGPITANIMANSCLIYLIAVTFRFYTSLLFGRSLSQVLSGIKSVDGFVWSRIGGGLRCCLELVPFMSLLDGPFLLSGRKTVKESISSTKLTYRFNYFYLFILIVYSTGVVFLSLGSPLLQNMTFVDGVKIAFSSVKLEKIDNRTDFSKFKHYPSESFKLSSFSAIKDNDFILIPSFEITREKTKKRIRPYLVIHDTQRKTQGNLKLERRFSFLKILQFASKYDPFFSSSYPELAKVLERPNDYYSIKKYEASFGDKKLLNPVAREEIQRLVQSSFELSFNNLLGSIKSNGPFISGHVKVRNLLLSLVDTTVPPTVDLVKLGNYTFIRFTQHFTQVDKADRKIIESYIPIETLNSSVLTVEWGSRTEDTLSREDFVTKFLGASKWFFDYSSVFELPASEEKFSAFTVLDHFSDTQLKNQDRERIEKYTFTYLYKLSSRSIKDNDLILRNALITSIERLVLLNNYARIKSKNKALFSLKFSKLMSNIKSALENKNKDFFKVN